MAVVHRRGLALRKLLIVLVFVLALPALGLILRPKLWSTPAAGPMMQTVERSDFIHEITDRGNVESANNVEIRCEVKAKGGGGTTILEMVPEGTQAKAGDVLMKLDASGLENDRTSQLIVCSNSEAALIQAQKVLDTAKITKQEYIEGQYEQAEKTAENEKFIAQEDYSKAKQTLEYSKRLATKGYIPQQQLEADRFAVEKGKKAVEIAEKKLAVLRDFTRQKMAVQLDSDIKTAEAKLRAQEASHKLELAHLELIESQIAKCIIRAPQDGQVVYANETNWRGAKQVLIDTGELVRERQVLIRMPDATRMQVVAKVNEGKVTMVSRGVPATVRLDAFPDLELQGTVEKVAEFPVPTSFMGSSVKEYETTIRIHQTPPGLRPGLTAEVRIRVAHIPNVIQVPVQSVFQNGRKFYCLGSAQGNYIPREVTLGPSNDKTVVIRDGLAGGDQIVLSAAPYRDKVSLPALPTETEQLATRMPQQDEPAAKLVEAAPAVGSQPRPEAHGQDGDTQVAEAAPAVGSHPRREVRRQHDDTQAAGAGPAVGSQPRPRARRQRGDAQVVEATEAGVGNQPRAPENPAMAADRLFRLLDKDGDGRLRLEDLPEKLRAAIQTVDLSSDGTIDREKWAALAGRFLKPERKSPNSGPQL